MATKTPVVLSGDGNTHEKLNNADTLDLSSIARNPAADNMTTFPPEGVYTKLVKKTTGPAPLSGEGTLLSPLAATITPSGAPNDLLVVGTSSVSANFISANSNTVTIAGYGTSVNPFVPQVKMASTSEFPDQMLTQQFTGSGGLLASLATAPSPTAELSGYGTIASPLATNVKVSSTEPNRLMVDATPGTGGLFVSTDGYNPLATTSIRPGASATVVPRFNPAYESEIVYLYAENTTSFTLDLSGAPPEILNKRFYRVRVICINQYPATVPTYINFITDSGTMMDPLGKGLNATEYHYPFGHVSPGTNSPITIIDVCINYSLHWSVHEVIPGVLPIEIFKQTASLTNTAATVTLNNSSLPYYMRTSHWAIRPTLFAMPTTSHNRTLIVTLGSTQLYNGTVNFQAGEPFTLPGFQFVVAPGTPGFLASLPNLVATWGTGTGGGTVAVKLVLTCQRALVAASTLDTL